MRCKNVYITQLPTYKCNKNNFIYFYYQSFLLLFMKKLLLFLCLFSFVFTSLFAQTMVVDSGAFNIHKFAQNIGKEKWVKTKNG